jgi:hypothetical protein
MASWIPAEILQPQPAKPEPISAPAPLSRADQQRLKRWEKHQAQRPTKLDRQQEQLREVARAAFELMEDAGWEPDSVGQFTWETYTTSGMDAAFMTLRWQWPTCW